MRRQAFLKAVENVVADLRETELAPMISKFLDALRKDSNSASSVFHFRTFLDYSLRAQRYSSAEQRILEVMGLKELQDPDWWQALAQREPSLSMSVLRAIRFTVEFLPYLAAMLERDYVDQTAAASKELIEQGFDTLSIVLVEDHGQRSTPDRLILALQGVSEIYQAIATIEGESHTDLSVVAIDSGSDKSFDFLGLAKVMVIFKETLIAIWDRRVFHRNVHVSMCVQNIAESLPIIAQIHQLKENGALSPEQAELLKRQMISGATKLLEVGAVSPEMELEAPSSPRALMRPEPKLLAAPIHEDRKADTARSFKDDDEGEEDSGELDEEQIRELEQKLKLAKKRRRA